MKCPKCDYLGFETGDRCKNCGYDFSLLSSVDAPAEPDLILNPPADLSSPSSAAWLDHLDRRDTPASLVLETVPESVPEYVPEAVSEVVPEAVSEVVPEAVSEVVPERPRPRLVEPSLPLFTPPGLDDDAPLIQVPATPRPPLAVRRTPETPRLRAVPKPSRRGAEAAARADVEPVLAFEEEASRRVEQRASRPAAAIAPGVPSTPGSRAAAAAIDHAILLGIDITVIYFTLRLADMSAGEVRLLPIVPLVLFLSLLKASYFCVFTLIGGQTIGKMAARIRVVPDNESPIDPARAIRRTMAGMVSFVTLGLAFLPALVASDRRALHDRVARTRVVSLS